MPVEQQMHIVHPRLRQNLLHPRQPGQSMRGHQHLGFVQQKLRHGRGDQDPVLARHGDLRRRHPLAQRPRRDPHGLQGRPRDHLGPAHPPHPRPAHGLQAVILRPHQITRPDPPRRARPLSRINQRFRRETGDPVDGDGDRLGIAARRIRYRDHEDIGQRIAAIQRVHDRMGIVQHITPQPGRRVDRHRAIACPAGNRPGISPVVRRLGQLPGHHRAAVFQHRSADHAADIRGGTHAQPSPPISMRANCPAP